MTPDELQKFILPRLLSNGYLYIYPNDDLTLYVDVLTYINYPYEGCFSKCFDYDFVRKLIAAGFLTISTRIYNENKNAETWVFAELHTVRSVLFFNNLHIKKTIRNKIAGYTLRVNVDYDTIISKCLQSHGDGWMTHPLLDVFSQIRCGSQSDVRMFCFGVYKDDKLIAGEFGTVVGKVYTSYSGFHGENNSGTVQMILTGKWLEQHGFAFWDLGMSLPYKTELGATLLPANQFVPLWRDATRDGAKIYTNN
jgi:Leu/Phe-tRNA-protein transferase